MSDELNQDVRDWWNKHPFTYGLYKTGTSQDVVGDVADEALDAHFFDEYMRKARKHFCDAQQLSQPLAARFIDYSWLKGKKVLDIACGFGWSTVEMARNGAAVTGIDITSRAIAVAQKHLEYRKLQAELYVMDAQQMEFPNGSFDFVHAWGCLMHMPDTERAVSEIYRVLRPGGRTSGYMYNKNSVTYWWHIWFLRGVLMGRLIKFRGNTTRLVSRYTDGIASGGNSLTKVYAPKAVIEMFHRAKFGHISVESWGPPQMLDGFPISRLPLGRVLPYSAKKVIASHYGWGMIFRAEKPS